MTIRLRLSGTSLELHVEAANPQTMRMIADDQDQFVGKLRASGYSVDAVVVKVGELQAVQGQGGSSAAQGGGDQSATQANPQAPQPGELQYGERSANDRSSTQRDRAELQRPASGETPDNRDGRLAGGDLYV